MRLDLESDILYLSDTNVHDSAFRPVYFEGWLQYSLYSREATIAILLAQRAGFRVIDPTGRDLTDLLEKEVEYYKKTERALHEVEQQSAASSVTD